jgi:hypothetical protein
LALAPRGVERPSRTRARATNDDRRARASSRATPHRTAARARRRDADRDSVGANDDRSNDARVRFGARRDERATDARASTKARVFRARWSRCARTSRERRATRGDAAGRREGEGEGGERWTTRRAMRDDDAGEVSNVCARAIGDGR